MRVMGFLITVRVNFLESKMIWINNLFKEFMNLGVVLTLRILDTLLILHLRDLDFLILKLIYLTPKIILILSYLTLMVSLLIHYWDRVPRLMELLAHLLEILHLYLKLVLMVVLTQPEAVSPFNRFNPNIFKKLKEIGNMLLFLIKF